MRDQGGGDAGMCWGGLRDQGIGGLRDQGIGGVRDQGVGGLRDQGVREMGVGFNSHLRMGLPALRARRRARIRVVLGVF